jgi:hypothetical protein
MPVCPDWTLGQIPFGRQRKSFLKSAQAGSASVKPMATIRQSKIEQLRRAVGRLSSRSVDVALALTESRLGGKAHLPSFCQTNW